VFFDRSRAFTTELGSDSHEMRYTEPLFSDSAVLSDRQNRDVRHHARNAPVAAERNMTNYRADYRSPHAV
jgi:hypothetical protein